MVGSQAGIIEFAHLIIAVGLFEPILILEVGPVIAPIPASICIFVVSPQGFSVLPEGDQCQMSYTIRLFRSLEQDLGTGLIYSLKGIHAQVVPGVTMIKDDGESLSVPIFTPIFEQSADARGGRSIRRSLDALFALWLGERDVVGETQTISAFERSDLMLAIRIERGVTQLISGGGARKRDLVLLWPKYSSALIYQHVSRCGRCRNTFVSCLNPGLQLAD